MTTFAIMKCEYPLSTILVEAESPREALYGYLKWFAPDFIRFGVETSERATILESALAPLEVCVVMPCDACGGSGNCLHDTYPCEECIEGNCPQCECGEVSVTSQYYVSDVKLALDRIALTPFPSPMEIVQQENDRRKRNRAELMEPWTNKLRSVFPGMPANLLRIIARAFSSQGRRKSLHTDNNAIHSAVHRYLGESQGSRNLYSVLPQLFKTGSPNRSRLLTTWSAPTQEAMQCVPT